MLIADKAFDADERVIEPLAAAGKRRSSRQSPTAGAPRATTATSTKHAI